MQKFFLQHTGIFIFPYAKTYILNILYTAKFNGYIRKRLLKSNGNYANLVAMYYNNRVFPFPHPKSLLVIINRYYYDMLNKIMQT